MCFLHVGVSLEEVDVDPDLKSVNQSVMTSLHLH